MKKAEKNLSISHLCELMDVPTASYYYRPVERSEVIAHYVKLMQVTHHENLHAYGKRRMRAALEAKSIHLGIFKVSSLMKMAEIIAKKPKKPHYYPSGKQLPTIPNLLKRQFNPDQINTHWVGDISYIRYHGGWRYLAGSARLGLTINNGLRPVTDTGRSIS